LANELKTSGDNISDDIEAILDGCRKNKRASQKILYDRYFERLYTHCQSYRLTDQDKISLINGTFESWVHTIHKNNILSHFRGVSRQSSAIVYDTDTVTGWGNQNGKQDGHLDMEYIHVAMQSLPELTRDVLELYAVQGYKHTEIARKLNMSESNSKYHLGKARELMAKKLRNHDG